MREKAEGVGNLGSRETPARPSGPATFKIRVADFVADFSPNSSMSPIFLFHNHILSLENRACRRFFSIPTQKKVLSFVSY